MFGLKILGCLPLFFLTGAVTPIMQVKVGKPPFVETSNSKVKTAGGEILGFVDLSIATQASGDQILVRGLTEKDRSVCVSVRHIAGTYSANVTVPKPSGARALSLVLPANKIDGLKAKRGELAILARASASGACSLSDPLLPASWGRQENGAAGYLLLNDHQCLQTRAAVKGTPLATCTRLRDVLPKSNTFRTYQVACKMPINGACGESVKYSVSLRSGASVRSVDGYIRNAC